jgi:mannose-6-phosphate isomerase-like protein (cupin superfamily)
MTIYPGKLFNHQSSLCEIREIFYPETAQLQFLSAMEMRLLPQGRSAALSFKGEECLIFNLHDSCTVEVDGTEYLLSHYDVLYIPVGSSFRMHYQGIEEALLYVYRAEGSEIFPVHHSKWAEMKSDKNRIRYLNRKEVFIMFDVGEQANKFIAGYTFYENFTRAWPPHNHTDQEEVYSFIEGKGAMEVYEDDEHKTFVTSVHVGDHITIPMLNYHPVFSHEEPVTFIWCIAGERYWVGDKNKDFMTGKVDKLTT